MNIIIQDGHRSTAESLRKQNNQDQSKKEILDSKGKAVESSQPESRNSNSSTSDSATSSLSENSTPNITQATFLAKSGLKEEKAQELLSETTAAIIKLCKNSPAINLINIFEITAEEDNNKNTNIDQALKDFQTNISDLNHNGIKTAFQELPHEVQTALAAEFHQKGLPLLNEDFSHLAIGELCKVPGAQNTIETVINSLQVSEQDNSAPITAKNLNTAKNRGIALAALIETTQAQYSVATNQDEKNRAKKNLEDSLKSIFASHPPTKAELEALKKTVAAESNTPDSHAGKDSNIKTGMLNFAKKLLGNKAVAAGALTAFPMLLYIGAQAGSRIPFIGQHIAKVSKPLMGMTAMLKDFFPIIGPTLAMSFMNGRETPPAVQHEEEAVAA